MIEKMGMSDEELEGLTSEMMSAFEGAESLEGLMGNLSSAMKDLTGENTDEDEDEEEGRTATFPFLNKLMGNMMPAERESNDQQQTPPKNNSEGQRDHREEPDLRLFRRGRL